MKLLVDMNMSPRWVRVLTVAGFEAIHWSKLGLAAAPDHEIMAHAEEHGYVVFTNDLDFGAILAETQAERPSVVQVRVGILRPNVIGTQVVEMLRRLGDELEQGAFVSIDPKKTRVRVLPLKPRE
jgi:predicted nuclease of predicted toxin-antitoxin system